MADLEVLPDQEDFVASNVYSLAEAHYHPTYQPLAIYQGEEPVGFLMFEQMIEAGKPHEYDLFRFMIDQKFQNQGIGRQAMQLVLDEIQQLPHVSRITICYELENTVAIAFYASFGFQEVGLDEDGEMIAEILTGKEYQMKILPYVDRPVSFTPWQPKYLEVAGVVSQQLSTANMSVIHIGSTAAKVSGKGVIDLSLLYQPGEFEQALAHVDQFGFQSQTNGKPFPDRRPRRDGAIEFKGETFLLHVHLIEEGCEEHQKQIAFRDHMLNNPAARQFYEAQKQTILDNGETEHQHYGAQKSPFIQKTLSNLL
ncbi:GNAT family N-acetyltransferase [Algicola sagamiensis]|uniref:GNAT family N-acetyltransferase n=1 Tax=Algicola sagamiensis TaxID=163869 RepID=UPI003898DDCF